MRLPFLLLVPALSGILCAGAVRSSSLQPGSLRCEYRQNPLGLDEREPRLSWVLTAKEEKARSLRQSAYRVVVASDEQRLRADRGDLWDTGRIASDQSIQVVYRGKALTSGARAFWKVQVWDQDGNAAWSAPAFWTMGLLERTDWKGNWIGRDEAGLWKNPLSPFHGLKTSRWIWRDGADQAPHFFRKTIVLPANRKLLRAKCILAADNSFELFVNGDAVGRGSYAVMPEVLDITGKLHGGENLLAVSAIHPAKNGKAGMIGVVRLEFDNGEPMLIGTDSSWRVSTKNAADWQQASFSESGWSQARELGPYGMAPWGEVGFSEERALPARLLRKEFQTSAKIRRATAYVSGLGLFELYLNGHRIGDQVLAPGLTDYDKRVQYVTFDVTRQIAAGNNALGLMLGNGRYWAPRAQVPIPSRSFGYPKARLQLQIEYEDGTGMAVATDGSWKLSTNGPVRANNEYDGEEFDARLDRPEWSRPGFNDLQWEQARVVAAPPGALVAQMAEPLRVTETVKPVAITEPRPGVYVFDMGQNMVGWCRLHVSGAAGVRVQLRHAETLRSDGELYVENLRSAKAADQYTLRGGGKEEWEPRFTYHGFRYVEVTGYPGKPDIHSLEGRVVHDDMERVADFQSSNAMLNQIHHNVFWGVRGNYRSIPTDCPQRDERQGWLGDRSQVSRSEAYLFNVAAFYSKWETDLADSQRPNGSVPDVSPSYWSIYTDDTTWPSTLLFVPGMLHDLYGDRRTLERAYPAMKKWTEYMKGFLKSGLMPKDTFGDWCVPPESPKLIHSEDPARKTDGTLIGTAYYYRLLQTMARYARLLDRQQDAVEYDALANQMRTRFDKTFFHADSGLYGNGTQTASILPLAFGMATDEQREKALAQLMARIEHESHEHVGVGLVGAQWLMRTLSDAGQADMALTIATQKTYPGWGYMIEKGATTIWELWNGDTADPAMNSGNHVMQIGDLGIWMYEYLGGIRPDPDQPAFHRVAIRPVTPSGLTFVQASHLSPYGMIRTRWQRKEGRFQLDVTVPPNTSATVYVPAQDLAGVTESGSPVSQSKAVKFLRQENGAAVYEVGSGRYSFAVAGR